MIVGLTRSNCTAIASQQLVGVIALQLQEFFELIRREPGVSSDIAHGNRVYGVVSGDGQSSCAVTHDDMATLTDNLKPNFLKPRTASR